MIDKLLYIHIFSYWSAVYYYMYKYDQWSPNSTKIMKSVFWNQVVYSRTVYNTVSILSTSVIDI